ncbi:MAG: phage antirepressor KilAC domain-containing protein [Roseburia sp.]|nr:phage antirepressor KilAC domain-containing protein [Roseburia sp.]
MNEIIKVNYETEQPTVSARELHKEVGSTERFSAWFNRQLQFGFVENEDYTTVKVLTEVQNNGGVQERELVDHNLTVDMAKQICMVQKNDRARAVRQYLIDLEKAWNTPEQVMARALKMANQTIDKLKDSNTVLLEDVSRMKPKEIFADAVATSHTSILIGDLAKLIKQNGVEIGQKRLFNWMRSNGYLIKRKGTDWNMPTQKSMEMELFEVKESIVNNPDGSVRINKTTKVTGRGQQYFINKFLLD